MISCTVPSSVPRYACRRWPLPLRCRPTHRRPTPSRSASSPRCPASRPRPAKRSPAASPSRSTRSTRRAACSAGASSNSLRRDDEANPAKGVIAARELIFKEKVAVLFGGLDTPVSMAIVPIANAEKMPFMGPWAAGTPITRTARIRTSCSAFRRSTRSSTRRCSSTRRRIYGTKSPGIILVNNPWGESNEKGLQAALAEKGMKAAGVEKFEQQRCRRHAPADASQGRRRGHAVPGR